MEPEAYWELFCRTGEPLAYILYREAEEAAEGPSA